MHQKTKKKRVQQQQQWQLQQLQQQLLLLLLLQQQQWHRWKTLWPLPALWASPQTVVRNVSCLFVRRPLLSWKMPQQKILFARIPTIHCILCSCVMKSGWNSQISCSIKLMFIMSCCCTLAVCANMSVRAVSLWNFIFVRYLHFLHQYSSLFVLRRSIAAFIVHLPPFS